MLMNIINSWGGIIGTVVGVIGIILSAFFYFKSKSRKLLEYRMISTQLITKKMISIPTLKVIIDGQTVKSLTSTTVTFINSGNQSISISDFAIKEPLGIAITGRLYSHDVAVDNPNSTPNLQRIDDKNYNIEFDFLKPKQSFAITLLHDGTVNVLGELRNGELREYRNFFASRVFRYIEVFLFYSVAIASSFSGYAMGYGTFSVLKDALPIAGICGLLLIPLCGELILFLDRKKAEKT